MSALSLPVASGLTRIFDRGNRSIPGPALALEHLLDRIGHRLYPESLSVLASWWLKTVYFAGHNRAWWVGLDTAIENVFRSQSLDATGAEAIRDIQAWVRRAILPRHKAPQVRPPLAPPFRPDLTTEQAAPYLYRALNEWLPGEVARLITAEVPIANEVSSEAGMPALTVAIALERLILREHLSPASLELLLETAWSSPKCAYPADLEIFRDVALAFLGRTAAPAPPVLPATPLIGEFADLVSRAILVGDDLHVPLEPAEALDILRHDPVRIASLIVTMDGRLWQSSHFQSGPETAIVYRPVERLRIDFTSEHSHLVVPWPFAEAPWPGAVQLPSHIGLFGREWRGRAWEDCGDRPCLHLEFSGTLALPEALGPSPSRPYHLRPASAEIAWSELEQALATGVPEFLDQLRREDLIPLAHALERLVNCIRRPWASSPGDFERSLGSVRYMHSAVAPVYGSIPWRVLPPRVRSTLLKRSDDTALLDVFGDSFVAASPAAQASPPRAA